MPTERTSFENSTAAILLVEDDAATAYMLTDVLEASGYAVKVAGTGAAARDQVELARPDLIILDLVLPDDDGLVLCSVLKQKAGAPILICSGTQRRRDALLSLTLGADDFIGKPFDVYDLLARVEVLLRRHQQLTATASAGPISSAPVGPSSQPQLPAQPPRTVPAPPTPASEPQPATAEVIGSEQPSEDDVVAAATLEGVRLAARSLEFYQANHLVLTVGYAELIAEDPEVPARLREMATQVLQSAQAAALIAQRLKHVDAVVLSDQKLPDGLILQLDRGE